MIVRDHASLTMRLPIPTYNPEGVEMVEYDPVWFTIAIFIVTIYCLPYVFIQ